MCKMYENEVLIINQKYVQEVSEFSNNIMNLNKKFSKKLEQLYLDIHYSEPELLKYLHLDDKKLTTDDLALLQVSCLLFDLYFVRITNSCINIQFVILCNYAKFLFKKLMSSRIYVTNFISILYLKRTSFQIFIIQNCISKL